MSAVVNVDWSVTLRIRRSRILRALAPLVLDSERLGRVRTLPDNIVVHDLRKGIPFDSGSVHVVYHSHLLEHLDASAARSFLKEVWRVLKVGGIQRVVVPDLERLCEQYLNHLSICDQETEEMARHDEYVAAIIEQSVRREAHGTSQQNPVRRFIENLLLGDARRRGETHQWMYDRINLGTLLTRVGFRNPTVCRFDTSTIPGWADFALDLDENGEEYKRGSLYMEAQK